jgi:phosphoribosylpyrophosphate synthetase
MARRYAKLLNLSVAIIRQVASARCCQRIIGDVREIVVVDDMITTGATIEKAIKAFQAGCSSSGIGVASHALVGSTGRLDNCRSKDLRLDSVT